MVEHGVIHWVEHVVSQSVVYRVVSQSHSGSGYGVIDTPGYGGAYGGVIDGYEGGYGVIDAPGYEDEYGTSRFPSKYSGHGIDSTTEVV